MTTEALAVHSRARVAGGSAPLRWRLWYDVDRAGPENMAVDHALAESLGRGEAVLRFYRWSVPTVSLGRNQPARGRYDLARARELGIGFVRRPTGGRAVLHDRELTYAAIFPVGALGGPRAAYRRLNRALADGLNTLGADVRAVVRGEVSAPVAERICFDAPAPGELVAEGGKMIGSAQARLGSGVLQHGSILLVSDQSALGDVTRGFAEMAVAPVTLERHLGRLPSLQTLADTLAEAVRRAVGGQWAEGGLRSEEERSVEGLLSRYRSAEWTWRR